MAINRVMLVDDNDADLFLSEYAIKKYSKNIDVETAYDGQEAIENILSSKVRPELIFLDINMPRLNGFEFLETYEQSNLSSIVVMLSTSDTQEEIDKAFSYKSVRKFVTKPLRLDDLREIEEILNTTNKDN